MRFSLLGILLYIHCSVQEVVQLQFDIYSSVVIEEKYNQNTTIHVVSPLYLQSTTRSGVIYYLLHWFLKSVVCCLRNVIIIDLLFF